MTDETNSLPETPEGLAGWIDGLTFHQDQPVAEADVPPLLAEGAEALVPRSLKIPQRLDAALQQLADGRGISKSELIRQYLETAVAVDLATDVHEQDVLIPLADALRALTALRHLPRTA
jgi:hypothetical protein